MARKRTPDQPSTNTEISATPSTTTITDGSPVEPVLAEVQEEAPSFVARIEQERRKKMAADPFGIAGDYVAGVRLFENRKDYLMVIKFEDKPSQEVLDKLKDAGYRWNSRDKVWVHPIWEETARATRIEAERLYQEVRGMIRQEMGIESGQEIPF